MSEKIESLEGFIEKLSQIKSNFDEKNFLLCFRGHSDYNFTLIPPINRPENIKYIEHEDVIFDELMLEKLEDFAEDKTTFDKLVRMQHYGFPTRLLDITTHPLVALYFACSNYPDDKTSSETDGEVIIFNIPIKRVKYSDDFLVSILSNISRLKKDNKDFNNKENRRRLLNKAQLEMPWYNGDIDLEIFKIVVPVKAPKNSDRIKSQYGLFFLFASTTTSEHPFIPQEWILTKDKEIIIDKEFKEKIREELKTIYVSHNILFPPNLDDVINLLKEKYK